MAHRTARDKARQSWAYHELYEGSRPSIPALQPAKFLPVAAIDKAHDDDPIIMLPGTFVGRGLGAAEGNWAIDYTRPLVPACPTAYTLEYTALDFGQEWGATPDIDGDGTISGVVSSAATSTQTVAANKPIGLCPQPVYASYLGERYTNYNRNLEVTQVLVQNQAILIPAITAKEITIEPGDKVCLDFALIPNLDWSDMGSAGAPGRLARVEAETEDLLMTGVATDTTSIEVAIHKVQEYTVGRCIDKFPIAKQTATSAGQTLTAAVAASNVDIAEISKTWGYWSTRLVQTVPGLTLPGSGTLGVPGYLTFAEADAPGYWWGLVIVVQVA